MAFEIIKNKEDEQEAFSLNQLDPSFYDKIMSRNSSADRPSFISTHQDSDVKIPLDWEVQPGMPRYDRPVESMAVVRERVLESKRYNLDEKNIEAARSSGTSNSSGTSASDGFKDFEFLSLDVNGGNMLSNTSPSSSRSSPSQMLSPTCSIKPSKSRFQYVARGLVKWVLAAKANKNSE